MKIIHTILKSEHFTNQPPVLIDIGASGSINEKWETIAPYSVCIAFDADDREFKVTEETNKTYRNLITINRIVTTDEQANSANFYLTESPFCSSLLEPDLDKLSPWVFKDLFNVHKVTFLQTVNLKTSLQKANVNYIDWFKTDTQGTDLRLFTHLSDQLRSGILAAEFEPGILDAYKGEDKLYGVLQEMHQNSFWLSSMKVLGTQRVHASLVPKIGAFMTKRAIRRSPGWAEVTYLREPILTAKRQLLLLFVFALLEKQYGFALEIAEKAQATYSDPIFQECRNAVWKKINAEKLKVPLVILKRQIAKLFASIND